MTAHLSLQAEQERMIRDQRIQDALFGAIALPRTVAGQQSPSRPPVSRPCRVTIDYRKGETR